MSAVHTKKPDTACAAGVMRKVGWSWLSRGASGSHEMLGPVGATVGGGLGAAARGEPSPSLSERGTSRLHSRNICEMSENAETMSQGEAKCIGLCASGKLNQ